MILGSSTRKLRAKLAKVKPTKTQAHMKRIASHPFMGAS